MAENKFRNVSGKYLNATEQQAISKLMKIHRPILREMEKWKEQREKLETALIDQIDMIGKILKPYYEQSQETLANITRRKQSATPNKKSPSKSPSRRKSSAKKSRSR